MPSPFEMMGVFFEGRPTSLPSPTSLTSLTCPTCPTRLTRLTRLTCWACLTCWVGGLWLGALLAFFEGGFILGGMGKRRRTGRRSV